MRKKAFLVCHSSTVPPFRSDPQNYLFSLYFNRFLTSTSIIAGQMENAGAERWGYSSSPTVYEICLRAACPSHVEGSSFQCCVAVLKAILIKKTHFSMGYLLNAEMPATSRSSPTMVANSMTAPLGADAKRHFSMSNLQESEIWLWRKLGRKKAESKALRPRLLK